MKKLVLLLSVIVLLVIATGAVSAAKPAPDTFTITGYTTLAEDPETVAQRAPAGSHFGTGRRRGDAKTTHSARQSMALTCQALCLASQGQPCGVVGLINGKPVDGKFTFEEWVDVVHPDSRFTAENEGTVVITALNKKGTAVVNFNGTDRLGSVYCLG